ncbi:hypothetical protein ES703_106930 [subsurface metagenome]
MEEVVIKAGNKASPIFFIISILCESTIPPWGPGNVLWVLPNITSAPCSSGFGKTPPAMSPATCEKS